MRITANFDLKSINISSIAGDIKANISKSLNESAVVIKKNIKAELRSPNKSGTEVVSKRYKRFSERRSAPGESLARESGASERLISSNKLTNDKLVVGFAENPYGFEYVKYQEEEKNRPTMRKSIEKSLPELEAIFDKNLKPKG